MRRRWYSYWDLRAANRNMENMWFRQSNGETLPELEWEEADAWLAAAGQEFKAARGKKDA